MVNRTNAQGNDIFLIINGKHTVLIASAQPMSIITTDDWIRVPDMMSSVAINRMILGIEKCDGDDNESVHCRDKNKTAVETFSSPY
ncbi:hypothetical protein AC249_AIPGENE837 [Exaiptasia diaphana]|nr:hypothetical protein AC249_AIPGENE837 [Exaiptasia diaphana]